MGYLFGQKRRKVGRLQRQAARYFLFTLEASNMELGAWCWPRVVLIEKRPLTESELVIDELSELVGGALASGSPLRPVTARRDQQHRLTLIAPISSSARRAAA